MKLLLDENISRRIVPLLVSDYPGTSQVALLGLESASDIEIWEYAKKNEFFIVTKDADFYDMSLVHGSPPKVLWLKSGNVSKAQIAQVLLSNRESIETALVVGGVNCVEVY